MKYIAHAPQGFRYNDFIGKILSVDVKTEKKVYTNINNIKKINNDYYLIDLRDKVNFEYATNASIPMGNDNKNYYCHFVLFDIDYLKLFSPSVYHELKRTFIFNEAHKSIL